MLTIKFRYVEIFVVIILTHLFLVSGCMNFGGIDKISDLQKDWQKYDGKNVTVTGSVIGSETGLSTLCEVDTRYGTKVWVDLPGYVLADDTGQIGILTCNSPHVGDEVRVMGIFHTGTVGVQIPSGRYAGYHTSGSPPSIELISQTIIKKNSKVTATVPHKATVYFFYSQDCPSCHNVIPFIQSLSKKYPDADFQIIEITYRNDSNYALFVLLNQRLAFQNYGFPEVIVDGNSTPLVGDRDIQAHLEGVILEQLK